MNPGYWLRRLVMDERIDNKTTLSLAAAYAALSGSSGEVAATLAELKETARIGSKSTVITHRNCMVELGYLERKGQSTAQLCVDGNSALSAPNSAPTALNSALSALSENGEPNSAPTALSGSNSALSAPNSAPTAPAKSAPQKENLSPTPPMKRKTTSVSSTDSTDSGRAGRPAREDSDDDTSPKQQELTPTTNDEPDDLATWMYRTAQNQGYDLTYEQAGAMVMRMMNRKLTDEECRELFVDSLAQAIAVEKPPAKWAYYFGSKEHVEMWRGDVNPSRSGVGKGKRDFQADGSTRKALEECEIATAEDNEQAFKDAGLE